NLFQNSGTYVGPDPESADEVHKTIRSEQIDVVDVSDPLDPKILNVLFFPKKASKNGPQVGRILSMELRTDGKIALATDNLVVLLDPKRLLGGQTPDE